MVYLNLNICLDTKSRLDASKFWQSLDILLETERLLNIQEKHYDYHMNLYPQKKCDTMYILKSFINLPSTVALAKVLTIFLQNKL
jgi:hypothetical protein